MVKGSFVKESERDLVFREVSGSAKGILGEREKLAEGETSKANCTYSEISCAQVESLLVRK